MKLEKHHLGEVEFGVPGTDCTKLCISFCSLGKETWFWSHQHTGASKPQKDEVTEGVHVDEEGRPRSEPGSPKAKKQK